MSTETNERLNDEQAAGVLTRAVRVVQDVMDMVESALQRVKGDDADNVFAARVEAQRVQDQHIGVQPGRDFALVRLHPLNSLWQMALRAAALLDRLLATTNPQLYAERKRAELDVRAAHRKAEKLQTAAA
ncbi:MAG: hypothetical protein KDB90_12625 [Planctomycetes bacterium]|nr:hypothetical protein [Planctomycetota bacterium]